MAAAAAVDKVPGSRGLAAVAGMVPAGTRDKGPVEVVHPTQAAAAVVDKGKLPAGILQVACMPCFGSELMLRSWR